MTLKFRVWCVNKNEWEKDEVLLSPKGEMLHAVGVNYVPVRKDTHELSFFTGLYDDTKWESLEEVERDQWVKDGNNQSAWRGKKIYEGDILFCKPQGRSRWGVVEWFNSICTWTIKWPNEATPGFLYEWKHFSKVVGNKWENHELLTLEEKQ